MSRLRKVIGDLVWNVDYCFYLVVCPDCRGSCRGLHWLIREGDLGDLHQACYSCLAEVNPQVSGPDALTFLPVDAAYATQLRLPTPREIQRME